MAYTINKTDGTVLTTIADSNLDATTNLNLPGKGYQGYGEVQNENYIKLLENFANTVDPTRPIVGQTFYNKTSNQLEVYDGTDFKAVGTAIVSSTQPTGKATGDLWFDSNNNQLFTYTGSAWVLIGPPNTSGTAAEAVTITDSSDTDRTVIRLTSDGTTVGYISSTTFTPKVTINGFSQIKVGITLASTAVLSNVRFTGTATDSDALGGIAAANYLRSNADDTTTGVLTVANDSGVRIGVDTDMTFTVSGTDGIINNANSNGNILLKVNDGGVVTTALTVDGATASVTVENNLTVGGNHTVTGNHTVSGTSDVQNLTVQGNLTVEGTQTILNTSTLAVEDNVVVLNNGQSGAPSLNGGIEIERGTSTNKTLIWDETTDKWTVGSETFVAGTVEANLTGNVTGNVVGTVTGSLIGNVTGNVTGDVTGNITGDHTGNIITNAISSSDSTAIQINDGVNISGTLSVDTIDTNNISSNDSSVVTIQDGLNVGGPIKANDSTEVVVDDSLLVTGTLTADNIVGQVVIGAGSPGAGTVSNVSLDMSTGRFFEVYVNADVEVNATDTPNGTIKFITIVNTGSTARTITLKIGGVTQQTTVVGDDSTINGKVQIILFSYINQKYFTVQNVVTT